MIKVIFHINFIEDIFRIECLKLSLKYMFHITLSEEIFNDFLLDCHRKQKFFRTERLAFEDKSSLHKIMINPANYSTTTRKVSTLGPEPGITASPHITGFDLSPLLSLLNLSVPLPLPQRNDLSAHSHNRTAFSRRKNNKSNTTTEIRTFLETERGKKRCFPHFPEPLWRSSATVQPARKSITVIAGSHQNLT